MMQFPLEVLAPFVMLALFGVFVTVVAYFGSKANAEARKREAERFRSLGFEEIQAVVPGGCVLASKQMFTEHQPWAHRLLDDLQHLSPFTIGTSRTIHRAYRRLGEHQNILCFLYSYTVSTGKSSTTHYQDIVLVEWDKRFPMLAIREEGFFDRMVKFVGVQDIQFEDVQFNERFNVQCESAEFAYAFFHPLMMERMNAEFLMPFTLIGDRVLMVFESGNAIDHIGSVERLLSIFEEHLPDYVAQDHRWPFVQGESRMTQGALGVFTLEAPR